MRIVSSVCAAALLTGCAGFTGSEPPLVAGVTAPAQWSAGEALAQRGGAGWLNQLDDPQLVALVEEALRQNYNLAASAARLDQADALALSARSVLLPSLNGSAGASGTRLEQTGTTTESYSLGASAAWEADVWGQLRASARAGRRDADAAAATLEDARLSLAGAVARAWFDVIAARLQKELAEDDVATQESSLSLTTRRFQRGVSEALDVRLLRSALASSQSNLAARSNALNDAERRLEVLLGRYPGAEIDAAEALPELPALGDIGAPADVLVRRPDLRAAEARLQAAGLRAEVARKALLPSLSFTASTGSGGDSVSDLFDPDTLISNAAGNLVGPIFQGGRLRADILRTEAATREQVATYSNAVLEAFREVEDALDAERFLILQEDALAIAADEAVKAEELAVRDYTRGVGTVFELLDAQRRRISAQTALINARSARVSNRVLLHLAVGGAAFDPAFSPDQMTAPSPAPGQAETVTES